MEQIPNETRSEGRVQNGVGGKPATAAVSSDPVREFLSDITKGSQELGGKTQLDREIGSLDTALKGVAKLNHTAEMPLRDAALLPDLGRDAVRVVTHQGDTAQVFQYEHGTALPDAVRDAVGAAKRVMRFVH